MLTLKVDHEVEMQTFHQHHAEELFQMIHTYRDYLRVWLPWIDELNSPFNAHSFISIWLKQYIDGTGLYLGIRYKGKLVGCIDLHQIDWHNRLASIGYFLISNAQGKGLMTRTVSTLLQYSFIELGLNRIEIRCGEKNIKSRAIPERLGFTYEGCIREGENLHGRFHHLFLYSILAEEWAKKGHIF